MSRGRGRRRPHWTAAFAFPAALGEIPAARRRVADEAERCGLGGTGLYDLLLAVGEALSNAVRHGSPQREFDDVTVRVGRLGRAVVVEVIDRGPGFAASRIDLPGAQETEGRGIPSMRALVDELRFDCHAGGTSVVLVKRLKVP